MLFVLDHDVDHAVMRMLHRAGHGCVTIGGSGMATASDNAVSVFAEKHDAVVITHDKEFFALRRRNTFSRTVLVACNEWDAAEVLKAHLDDVIQKAYARDATVIRLSKDGAELLPTRWE